MKRHLKQLVIAFSAMLCVNAYADLLPTSNTNNDNNSLSSRVIDKDIQGLTKSLFRDQNANLSNLSAFNNVAPRNNTATTKKDDASLLDRLNNVASSTMKKFIQNGIASWYGRGLHGRPTASGERFDMNALTAAHRSLPLNCYIRVTNKSNGKSVIVKVNDRGPFHGNRVLDLSYGAAKAIGLVDMGSGNVTIERVDGPNS
ncbi:MULTISPECIES: septal ring lytic transglycosylase RlpA family protein [unclassified Acinetobacter]|uniref:septal ring lytic transglycosylase RlpA family protein n=1 Tax=unclassified Acinetobacter TaxID=196816 RepID=UPI0035B6C7E8